MRFVQLSLLASTALAGCDAKSEEVEDRYLDGARDRDEEMAKEEPGTHFGDESGSSGGLDAEGPLDGGTDGSEAEEDVIRVVVPEFVDDDLSFHKKKPPTGSPAKAKPGPKAVKQVQAKAENIDSELNAVLEELEHGK